MRFWWCLRTLKAAAWLTFGFLRIGEPVAGWLPLIAAFLLGLGIITVGVYGTAAATGALPGDPVQIWLGLLSFTTLLAFAATVRLQAKLVPFRRPLPANTDAIVRLLPELERRANRYFQACASSWFPPSMRKTNLHPKLRDEVDEVTTKLQAELRVASIEGSEAAVGFQEHIADILTRGRVVTKQALPDLRVELSTAVSSFLAALKRGDL